MTSRIGRREFVRWGMATAGAIAAGSMAEDGPAARPNILVLLTDDQRFDLLGCAGHPILRTPHIDALAGSGVRFTNAFVTTSICAASRASILTGLYERTHRFTFGTPPLADGFVDRSYPVLLRQAGYRTGFVGKLGVGMQPGATSRLFDWFRPMGRTPYLKPQADGSLRHLTDLTADAAVSFIEESAGTTPFCLSVSFNAPHAEDNDPRQYIWPEAMDHLYGDAPIPPPPTSDPAFFEAQPRFLRESMNRVRWHWRFETPEKARDMTRGYFRMISGVDAAVGRIMAALERRGVDANTVVIFTADNGYFLGERGFAGKWLIHEPSIRVPLIVRDPRRGAARGALRDQMALNVDLAPTILELAGLRIPEEMQGASLLPLLAGKPVPWREDFFYEHLFDHPQIPKCEGVRTRRWTYVRYFEQDPVFEELYDLEADPRQEHNLAAAPAPALVAAVLTELRSRTDALRDRYGGPFQPWPRRQPASRPPTVAEGPAALVPGVRGKAAAFDGRHYVRGGLLPAIPADGGLTVSFWLRIDPDCPPAGVIVGNRRLDEGEDTRQFMKLTATGLQVFSGKQTLRLEHAIPKERWVHVAIVKDGADLGVHVDGEQVAAGRFAAVLPPLPFFLGGDPRVGEMAVCQLDEVRVHTRALPAAERAESRNHGPAGPEALWRLWTFDD